MRQALVDRIQHEWLVAHVIDGVTLNVGCGIHPYAGCKNIDPNPDRQPRPDSTADVHALPWADNTFAAVVSCHVLPALQDIDTAMREMVRVLRPGGYMAHVVPDWSVAPRRSDPRFPWDVQHQGWYDANSLREFFESFEGLRVEICELFPEFHGAFRVVAYKDG